MSAGAPAAAAPVRGVRARWALDRARHLVELLDTDVIVWDAARPLPRARAKVACELVRVSAEAPNGWEALVPVRQHRDVRRFLARRDVGHLATVDGQLAGWAWLTRRTHRDPWSGLRIRLAADEAYAYALWVKPELRPAGIATVVMAALLEEAQTDTSLSRVYGWVDRPNRQSAVLLRMVFGFTQVQSIKRLHLARRFGRQLPFSAEPSFGPLSRRGRHAERVPAPVDPET